MPSAVSNVVNSEDQLPNLIEAPRPSRQDGTGTPGLPGNVISSYIVPLDPARSARLAGHVPANLKSEI